MTRWQKWIAALVGSFVLCVAGFLILKYGVIASSEVREAAGGQHEPFCYPPPRRRAGTVREVSPTRLDLDQGKDRMGRESSIIIGFVCKPSACAQLQGVAKGDKVEAIFGATSVSGGRPLTNELLEIRVGEPENRDTDFEPAPCLGAAEVTAASLMRQKDTAPWPKTGVFAGYYRQQFEVSDFRPAGTSERWWVRNKAGGSGFGAMCGMSDPCYLIVRGELSGQGWHGHMSAYNRELRVIEVIEKRVLTPDEKSPFKSPFQAVVHRGNRSTLASRVGDLQYLSMPAATKPHPASHRLAERLRKALEGEVLFDSFSRGRYATDASHYQIEPVGVVVPKSDDDVRASLEIAREESVPLLPRGGGTSQSGQTVGRALVLDFSKYLKRIVALDAGARTCTVEPGIVLDDLNRQLKPTGLWFPVDVSTASRATIGGMAGNNSCGTRSIRYGIMRDNVLAIDAILADGSEARFGEVGHNLGLPLPAQRQHSHEAEQRGERDPGGAPGEGEASIALFRDLLALGRREAEHIARAFPEVSRRVGGYLIDALIPGTKPVNLATLLCGSEGTLALSRRIELKLSPLPRNKALGICHFAAFRKAMEATQHIVKLGPVAVEVVDRTLIELARDIAMFRPVMDTYVRGHPDALLLVEFAEDDQAENLRRLDRLDELMGDLGHPQSVVKVPDAAGQKAVWEVRASGLNIMMSMKTEGKPVSFIEDCAVPLEHLADYTERLTAVFAKHGTRGTFYAHASVGCLHVRPVLNLKLERDARTMRAIAEEAFAMVREYKGSHSGEHGDGLVRSEFHARMYGPRTVRLFEEVKDRFDPQGVLNPGKIVRASRMDDRTLFRFKPDYRVPEMAMALDWPGYAGAGGGFQGAVEMCNNNGECRKSAAGVMCPSFRVTGNERDVTRGRANALRLAISGQLGPDALACDDMLEAMQLCVSCKGCRRECPTGVDMAKMKIEVLAAANARRGLTLRDRLVAWLPRYAPHAARLAPLMNARDAVPGAPWLSERLMGMTARRPLPRWSARPFHLPDGAPSPRLRGEGSREVALLADTFNRYFEPENLEAAVEVLGKLGYRVTELRALPGDGARRLCCGRTFLSAGLVGEARAEARRLVAAAAPLLARGAPIVGLEPSCLLTLRDEFQAMLPGADAARLASRALLFEEFLAGEASKGRIPARIAERDGRVLLHGHCHQKAFGAMDAVRGALALVGGLRVETVESSCCGMAGAFGYGAETYDVSMAMGEISLLPAVRGAAPETVVAADGFSCRHQIEHGSGRRARHVASILREAMSDTPNALRSPGGGNRSWDALSQGAPTV